MDNSVSLIAFLKQNPLFLGLTDAELKLIAPFVKFKVYKPGDWIIRESEHGKSIYIVESGVAEIIKEEAEFGIESVLALLEKNDWGGEMALLEGEKRSASIRAVTETRMVVFLFEELMGEKGLESIFFKIQNNLIRKMSGRLRKMDANLIVWLKEKLRITRLHAQLGLVVIQMCVLIALYFDVYKVIQIYSDRHPFLLDLFVPIFLVFWGVSGLWIIRHSGYPIAFFGLTLHDWKRNLVESVLASIPILVILALMAWFLKWNYQIQDSPLFSFPAKGTIGAVFVYALLVPVQELMVRGIVQSSFSDLFQGKFRVILSIATSNLIFETLHVLFSLWVAFGAFLLGIFWGYLYQRQRSLLGPIVSHVIIGLFATFALDMYEFFGLLER